MRRTGSALVVSVLVALAAAGLGCMPSQDQGGPAAGTGGAGGASGTGGRGGAGPGSGGGGAGSGGAQGSGGAAGPDAGGETSAPASGSCTELRSRPAGADGTLALAVEATVAGKPLVFGEANSFAGGTLTPTNFRFYIAEPYLIQAGGARLPVDLVGADGRPLPYNVHLVSLESPETQVVRLAAPPGSYDGVGFLFGVGDACNAINPARQKAPLNIASQMTWPHATGYLFLRYEAQVTGVSGAPAAIHMGGKIGQIFAPDVALTVMGKLAVTTTPRPVALRVALDQIFAGAALEATLPSDFGPPSPEAIAGEHLRQNLSRVKVFSLAGP